MTERVNALVVTPEPPLPEGRGSGRLVLAMMRGLSQNGVDARLLAARPPWAMPGEPPPDCAIEVIDVPPERPGWAGRVERFRCPMGHMARGAFGERVREAARDADVIHLEEVHTAWCSDGVEIPSVMRLHYFVRWDRPLGPPWRRAFRHTLEIDLAERAAIRRHSVFAAASPRVAAEIRRRRPSARVELVPFCLEPRDYRPAELDGPPVAGLLGTAAWPPTRNAIDRLLGEVWPSVRRRVPGARLQLAGRGTEALKADVGAGVEVLGEVDSAAEFLRGLSVLLYPVSRGSGVKVKVLESLAVGVPVVTTACGAEGLEGDEGILVEDDAERLAAVAAALLADRDERRARGGAARRAFERRYTPEQATRPLAALYREMAG